MIPGGRTNGKPATGILQAGAARVTAAQTPYARNTTSLKVRPEIHLGNQGKNLRKNPLEDLVKKEIQCSVARPALVLVRKGHSSMNNMHKKTC